VLTYRQSKQRLIIIQKPEKKRRYNAEDELGLHGSNILIPDSTPPSLTIPPRCLPARPVVSAPVHQVKLFVHRLHTLVDRPGCMRKKRRGLEMRTIARVVGVAVIMESGDNCLCVTLHSVYEHGFVEASQRFCLCLLWPHPINLPLRTGACATQQGLCHQEGQGMRNRGLCVAYPNA
jgi:hypothetical protein